MYFDGIDKIGGMLNGLASQQKTITNNIVNAQTPGYTRQTYNFSDVLGTLSNPYETELSQKMGSASPNLVQGTGEKVDIGKEMVDMQMVYTNYSIVTRRLSSIFNNMRRATQIGR